MDGRIEGVDKGGKVTKDGNRGTKGVKRRREGRGSGVRRMPSRDSSWTNNPSILIKHPHSLWSDSCRG